MNDGTAPREWPWLLGSFVVAALVVLRGAPLGWLHLPGAIWTAFDVHNVPRARVVLAATILVLGGGFAVYALSVAIRRAYRRLSARPLSGPRP